MFTKSNLIQRLINILTQDIEISKRMFDKMITWSNEKVISELARYDMPVEKIGEMFVFKF